MWPILTTLFGAMALFGNIKAGSEQAKAYEDMADQSKLQGEMLASQRRIAGVQQMGQMELRAVLSGVEATDRNLAYNEILE